MRIRTVKPELWQHEGLASLPREVRMLAVGLLNWSDDQGYFRSHPALIAGAVLPYDADGRAFVEAALPQLASIGFVELGENNVGRIPGFPDHQVIHKPSKPRLKLEFVASPPGTSGNPPESPGIPRSPPEKNGQEVGSRKLEVGSRNTPRKQRAKDSEAVQPGHQELVDALDQDFTSLKGAKYAWSAADFGQLKRLRRDHPDAEIRARWRRGLVGAYAREVNSVAQLASSTKWNALATDEPKRPGGPIEATAGEGELTAREVAI